MKSEEITVKTKKNWRINSKHSKEESEEKEKKVKRRKRIPVHKIPVKKVNLFLSY